MGLGLSGAASALKSDFSVSAMIRRSEVEGDGQGDQHREDRQGEHYIFIRPKCHYHGHLGPVRWRMSREYKGKPYGSEDSRRARSGEEQAWAWVAMCFSLDPTLQDAWSEIREGRLATSNWMRLVCKNAAPKNTFLIGFQLYCRSRKCNLERRCLAAHLGQCNLRAQVIGRIGLYMRCLDSRGEQDGEIEGNIGAGISPTLHSSRAIDPLDTSPVMDLRLKVSIMYSIGELMSRRAETTQYYEAPVLETDHRVALDPWRRRLRHSASRWNPGRADGAPSQQFEQS
jgi:hypothetical protein